MVEKRKDRYWLSIFEDFDKSGVSKRQYCVAKDIPLSTFRYQWSRLRNQKMIGQELDNDGPASSFVPVICTSATTSTVSESPTILSFTLPNKICCELSISDSTDSLIRVLSTLVAI